jgi:hypothetical protein
LLQRLSLPHQLLAAFRILLALGRHPLGNSLGSSIFLSISFTLFSTDELVKIINSELEERFSKTLPDDSFLRHSLSLVSFRLLLAGDF